MKTPLLSLRKGLILFAAFAILVTPFITMQNANAAQITLRKLTLLAGGTDGGSKPGGNVSHKFDFTLPSSSAIGSMRFEYCLTAADTGINTCVAPAGLDTSSALLANENGVTGWTSLTDLGSNNNDFYVSKASAAAPAGANTIVSYTFSGIVNPTTENQTFFVRISTFASTDATGPVTDSGTVAAATAEPIVLDGIMPESLVFCTGETVGLDAATSTVPDCSTATDGTISFNQLFSPTDTAIATSQMAASTNAGQGYAITVNGTTLTSGSNTISNIGTTTTSNKGISQFGINLMANTAAAASGFPYTSADVSPTPNATNFRGQPFTGYGTQNQFTYNSGDAVAKSDNGGAGGTDAQIFTASYVVNVPGSQPAGTYTTTLTYICTPTF
jgi:hypothetical protein